MKKTILALFFGLASFAVFANNKLPQGSQSSPKPEYVVVDGGSASCALETPKGPCVYCSVCSGVRVCVFCSCGSCDEALDALAEALCSLGCCYSND